MFKIEMHFHTAQSSPCGRVDGAEGIRLYKEAGYEGVVVTDHFSRLYYGDSQANPWTDVVDRFLTGYREAREAGERLGVEVYLGMEICFPDSDNDYLLYGFDEEFLYNNPWLYETDLEDFNKLVQANDLFIAQAHPFRGYCSRADYRHLHGVEVDNANPRHQSHNHLAQAWAQTHELIPITGSDFHQIEDISGNGLIFETMPETIKELVQKIKAEDYKIAELESDGQSVSRKQNNRSEAEGRRINKQTSLDSDIALNDAEGGENHAESVQCHNEATPEETVDSYIAVFPPDVREILQQVRMTIREAAPEAEEGIAYKMPAYSLNGPLVYFAGYKKHIGFYPTPSGIEAFPEELAGYKQAKGSVQFPLNQPIPYELIRRIAGYRRDENMKKKSKKRK